MDVLSRINLRLGDCTQLMRDLHPESVDCILTDPPYLYLKGQKLDRHFDETAFFDEVKRILKKDGFIALFGRGSSFYRWNTLLADRGFAFKEEVVWDKGYISSPLMAISRIHETVSIHTRGNGKIRKVKVPYLEMRAGDVEGICSDLRRMMPSIRDSDRLGAILEVLEGAPIPYTSLQRRSSTTVSSQIGRQDRALQVAGSIANGITEKSVIRASRDHYTAIHPTQKPVRLLERLLALVTDSDDWVLDPFAGSGSTAIACLNTGRRFVGYEIDGEYHAGACHRIASHQAQGR